MNIQLPEKVKYIIRTLERKGYPAYVVGGCVRDSVLGRNPADWDITTSARPREVQQLFRKTIGTGIKHGTVTVLIGGEGFEVTTFRIDGIYEDSRHPKNVIFTPDLLEDLRRRDFTINAMAYNEREGFVDAFGGMEDLKNHVIRCVGSPHERFTEDALRMMRALRFAAQLGFAVEAETFRAIRELSPLLSRISAERVQTELVKLLISDHPERMRELYICGITDVILPEFSIMMKTPQHNIHHMYSVGEHTIHAIQRVRADKVLRITMLLHDVGKPACRATGPDGVDHFHGHPQVGAKMAHRILKRLKFDNDTIGKVTARIRIHDERPPLTEKAVRRLISRCGRECFPDFFAIKRADILAQSSYRQKEKLSNIDVYERLYRKIMKTNACLSIKDLAVNGSDLIAAGMKPGKEIGGMLHRMLEDVIEQPEHNSKKFLLEKYLRKH